MIKFEHVTKIYPPDTVALHDIDIEIHKGEFISIVGRSGAGKTTLLKLLTREERPTHGSIVVEGIDIGVIKSRDLPLLRRKIGVVFQDIKLLSTRTAFENVAFALEASGISKQTIKNDAREILELVGLSERIHAFPNQLSGGEKQRVAIARALSLNPILLLADEPTGNLDSINAMEILNLLKRINELGTTVVLATHAKSLVDKIRKRVIVLDRGEIISDEIRGKYNL